MAERPIYVYTSGSDSRFESVLDFVMGTRYMALAGAEWPRGEIVAYGYTAAHAYRKAVRKLRRKPGRQRELVAQWTEAGERVR